MTLLSPTYLDAARAKPCKHWSGLLKHDILNGAILTRCVGIGANVIANKRSYYLPSCKQASSRLQVNSCQPPTLETENFTTCLRPINIVANIQCNVQQCKYSIFKRQALQCICPDADGKKKAYIKIRNTR